MTQQLPAHAGGPEPGIRLELSNEDGRQVWSIYTQENERQGYAAPGVGFALGDIAGILRRGKWRIAICTALAGALGALYLLVATPVYDATAQVLIERRSLPFQGEGALRVDNGFLGTQAEIFQSPVVAAVAAERSEFVPTDALDADPVAEMLASLTATPILGTHVVALSFRNWDPAQGARVLGAIIESYQGYVQEIEAASHAEGVTLLGAKEAEIRQDLTDLQRQQQALRAQSDIMGDERSSLSVHTSFLEQTSSKLVDSRQLRIALENEYQAALASGGNSAAADVDASPHVRNIQDQLWQAEVRAAELLEYNTDEHPAVQAALTRIAILKQQLSKNLKVSPRNLAQRLKIARRNETRLASAYQLELEKGKNLDSYRLREEQLSGEIQRLAAIHETTLSMLKEREIALRALETNQAGVIVRQLKPPTTPLERLWPRPALVMLPCLFLGGLGGLGLSIAAEQAKRSAAFSSVPVARRLPS